MLHETLWEANADLASRCLEHPFVQGLADGTLDQSVFKRYVAQDAFFLRAFFRAYALAAARCDHFEHARALHELMAGVLEELTLHADYAKSLAIDLVDVTPYAGTSAYTDFLLRVAWQNSVAEIFAAMVPCMRLYQFLGEELRGCLRPDHPYRDWIKTYSSNDFRQLCTRIESLLDDVATDCAVVRDAYRYAMQCELDFFSAPLENAP